jgi:hypothetical protein
MELEYNRTITTRNEIFLINELDVIYDELDREKFLSEIYRSKIIELERYIDRIKRKNKKHKKYIRYLERKNNGESDSDTSLYSS